MNTHTVEEPARHSFFGFLRSAAIRFFDLLGDVAEAYDALPLENKHIVKAVLVRGMGKTRRDLEAQALFRQELELADILCRHDWWVLERDITGPIQREILRLGREGKSGQLDHYLCQLFTENGFSRLDQKIVKWFEIPYLNSRRELIAQCVAAHKERKFFLSVCALLPMLDGLTRSFRREVLGRGAGRSTSRKPRRRTIEVMLVAGYYLRREPALWGRPFFQFVDKRVYGKFAFGSGVPAGSLNRHAILHGEASDYGTEANSLKVFLLLDALQHFFKEVQRQKAERLKKKATPVTHSTPTVQRHTAMRTAAQTSLPK